MPSYHYYDLAPDVQDMMQEVLSGLLASPKKIEPKYFYDENGSRLFEEICKQPEYYVTNTEIEILSTCKNEIISALGDRLFIVEYGCGNSLKSTLLLEYLRPIAYMVIDINATQVKKTAQNLVTKHAWLSVHAACADYSRGFDLPWSPPDSKTVVFFSGSSFGNFEPAQSQHILNSISSQLGEDGLLLIGIDMHKSKAILHAAYNDQNGVTELFNKNILHHINHALKANFNPDLFTHKADFNSDAWCVEMFLQSNEEQTVLLDKHHIKIQRNELIHTESSYKYTISQFLQMAKKSGLTKVRHWMDKRQYFSVFLLGHDNR